MRYLTGLVIVFLLSVLLSGCVSRNPNPTLRVTTLDDGDIPFVTVGNFDVYTASFQITNPMNMTVENVDIDVTLLPKLSYCHSVTKTFSYPLLVPQQKVKEQISIAEFSDLGCLYNYTYQVYSGSG